MSPGSWRGAEAVQKRREEQRVIAQNKEKAQIRRQRAMEEWHITGEPAFRPKERLYPNGGGVHGVGEFLASAEQALHLYDRGKVLTGDMSTALGSLGRRHAAFSDSCRDFCDKHASHMHKQERCSWEVGAQELRLFVEAAERMTPAQRSAFTNVLAPHRDKSEGHIEALEPLATRLQRAKNASIEQAVSGKIFGGRSRGAGRFARGVPSVFSPCDGGVDADTKRGVIDAMHLKGAAGSLVTID